jgi:hypothetical protein
LTVAADEGHGCQYDSNVGSDGADPRKGSLADNLAKLRMDVSTKDEEMNKTAESYKKTLDQLKTLSEQMESAKFNAVEEYKLFDVCNDNNTKYFLAGFELLRKQAKEKYLDLDFDIFQPYEDNDSVAPLDKRNKVTGVVDPYLVGDATT